MTAQLAAHGRLGGDPQQRESQGGTIWATGSIAVQLGDDDTPATWLGLRAFGKTAELLCKHAKGDMIAVSGRLQMSRWRGQDGADHEQLQVVCDSIVSARTVRPGGGRKGART
jgi:single-strand DNA-binding protein